MLQNVDARLEGHSWVLSFDVKVQNQHIKASWLHNLNLLPDKNFLISIVFKGQRYQLEYLTPN